MSRELRVDVCFDLICPWCWIGQRHLASAVALLRKHEPGVEVALHWHSVQLFPDVPPEGWPYTLFYERRLGGPEAVGARRSQVRAAAQVAGLSIDYERIHTFPNTGPAHELLGHAKAQLASAACNDLLQRLFEGYFQRGEHLGDAAVLAAIAAQHGVDLQGPAAAPDPSMGNGAVTGVPFFVFNRRLALSGAQPPHVLFGAMRSALTGDPALAS